MLNEEKFYEAMNNMFVGSKIDYINHIIKYESEHNFVLNFNKYLESNSSEFDFDWMFSKIDQTVDDVKLSIPYYDVKDNSYHNFYPDFIFWLKKR